MATTELTSLKPDITASCPADLPAMSRDELRGALRTSLARTVQELVRLAWIVRLLEERGEDLSDLRVHLLPYLRQIAYGQILPGIVVRYAESPLLMRSISALPIPDQERLARGESIPLAIRKPDGTIDHRLVDPLHLRRDQVAVAFARDHIRPVEEQAVLLEGRKPRKAREPKPAGRIRPDRERGGLVIGRLFVSQSDLVAALAMLAGADEDLEDEDETQAGRRQIGVSLTLAQYERLREAAYKGDVRMPRLARRAMQAYGLI